MLACAQSLGRASAISTQAPQPEPLATCDGDVRSFLGPGAHRSSAVRTVGCSSPSAACVPTTTDCGRSSTG